jgi:hypothetical protein
LDAVTQGSSSQGIGGSAWVALIGGAVTAYALLDAYILVPVAIELSAWAARAARVKPSDEAPGGLGHARLVAVVRAGRRGHQRHLPGRRGALPRRPPGRPAPDRARVGGLLDHVRRLLVALGFGAGDVVRAL